MKKILLSCILIAPIWANSVSIKNYYEKALDYESKVKSYEYQVVATKEDIVQAKSQLYPTINMQVSATSRDYKTNYGHNNRDENYYTYTMSGNLPIYRPEIYNNIDQSNLKYKFSNVTLKQMKQELAYNVTDAFMAILRAKNSLVVAGAYLEANKIRYDQINKMYEKQLANKMDLLEAKVTYEQSKVKVSSEKHNLYLAKFKFKDLTGIKNVQVGDIDLEKVDVTSLLMNFKVDDLIKQNLEIKKANINIKVMKKQIKKASYGHYPTVDLSASASKYDTDSIYTDYKYDSKVMVNVNIPIYQGGYVSSDIAKNKYLLSASMEDLKDARKDAISQFEELMVKLSNSKENIMLNKEAIKSAELYLHAVNKGYDNGLRNLIDVEDAKTKLFDTKFDLIDSVYQYIQAYAAMLNLYGGFDDKKILQIDRVLLDF